MSAVNIAVAADHETAFILTDSLAYRLDGRIDHYAIKAYTFPHARAVITARGNIELIDQVLKRLKRGADFDEMANILQFKCPRLITIRLSRALRRLLNLKTVGNSGAWKCAINILTTAEICIVGYSALEGGVRAIAATSAGEPAFELLKSIVFLSPGLTPPEIEELPNMALNDLCAWPSSLLKIMEVQRQQYMKKPGAEIIGGHAVLTTVTKDVIAQRVIHRWPDAVGVRFNPAPPAASSVGGLDLSGIFAAGTTGLQWLG
jgi:hypothetical protein